MTRRPGRSGSRYGRARPRAPGRGRAVSDAPPQRLPPTRVRSRTWNRPGRSSRTGACGPRHQASPAPGPAGAPAPRSTGTGGEAPRRTGARAGRSRRRSRPRSGRHRPRARSPAPLATCCCRAAPGDAPERPRPWPRASPRRCSRRWSCPPRERAPPWPGRGRPWRRRQRLPPRRPPLPGSGRAGAPRHTRTPASHAPPPARPRRSRLWTGARPRRRTPSGEGARAGEEECPEATGGARPGGGPYRSERPGSQGFSKVPDPVSLPQPAWEANHVRPFVHSCPAHTPRTPLLRSEPGGDAHAGPAPARAAFGERRLGRQRDHDPLRAGAHPAPAMVRGHHRREAPALQRRTAPLPVRPGRLLRPQRRGLLLPGQGHGGHHAAARLSCRDVRGGPRPRGGLRARTAQRVPAGSHPGPGAADRHLHRHLPLRDQDLHRDHPRGAVRDQRHRRHRLPGPQSSELRPGRARRRGLHRAVPPPGARGGPARRLPRRRAGGPSRGRQPRWQQLLPHPGPGRQPWDGPGRGLPWRPRRGQLHPAEQLPAPGPGVDAVSVHHPGGGRLRQPDPGCR